LGKRYIEEVVLLEDHDDFYQGKEEAEIEQPFKLCIL